MPFDPQALTPDASINRIRFAQLPPFPGHDTALNKTAFDLLSAHALQQGIVEAEIFDLVTDRSYLLRALSTLLADPNNGDALRLADTFGAYLACLIATLKLGAPANRKARPDWDDSYWVYWGAVQRVWLGGGVMSGRLGLRMVEAAQALLRSWHIDVALAVAAQPSLLPLIGLSRGLRPSHQASLLIDLGHTNAKAALATHHQDRAQPELRVLPSVSMLPFTEQTRDLDELQRARNLCDAAVALISQHWQQGLDAGLAMSPDIPVSIACYIADNHPMDYRRAEYAALALLCDNLGDYLSEAVSARVAHGVRIFLTHDCTAAARTYAGDRNAAVLMLGTSVGAGYPPPN